MSGYSGTPLWKKLNIKEGYHCYLFQPPSNYFDLLENTPLNTTWTEELNMAPYDFMHVFVTRKDELAVHWEAWKKALKKDGILWVSWPKKSSKVESELSEGDIRDFGLHGGLVDVKVCAVDDTWSGLKFMYRKKDR